MQKASLSRARPRRLLAPSLFSGPGRGLVLGDRAGSQKICLTTVSGGEEKMYTVARMWHYALAVGFLSSFFLAFGQQAELNPRNAVPQEIQTRVLQHAFTPGVGSGIPTLLLPDPTLLPPGPATAPPVPQALASKVCAVPLIETRAKETNDPIAHPAPAPFIDPTMVHAPPLPACSKP
jgi:hypothetical protein